MRKYPTDRTIAADAHAYRLHQAERMSDFARTTLGREPTEKDFVRMAQDGSLKPILGPDGKIKPTLD